MAHLKIKTSMLITYFVMAILLNSVGIVILQVQISYGISESGASVLEGFKDLSIVITSFLIASYIAQIGYRKSMMLALCLVGSFCLFMPSIPAFWMNKLMFAITGFSFAIIKISVFATISLVTNSKKEHVSFMNFLESVFMVGIMSGYFIFSSFVDDSSSQSPYWLNVYYTLSGLAFCAALILYFSPLDESIVKKTKTESWVSGFLEMGKLCLKPLIIVFVLSAFMYVLLEQSIMTWLPTFNRKILNLPVSLSIQIASILAFSTALGRLVAGFVLRFINWYYVVIFNLILAGVLVLISLPLAGQATDHIVTSWSNAPLAAYIFPLIGFALAPIYPVMNSVILSSQKPHLQTITTGLIVLFSALGGTTGSIITGYMFEFVGGETAFYFSLIPISLLLVLMTVFKKITLQEGAQHE